MEKYDAWKAFSEITTTLAVETYAVQNQILEQPVLRQELYILLEEAKVLLPELPKDILPKAKKDCVRLKRALIAAYPIE